MILIDTTLKQYHSFILSPKTKKILHTPFKSSVTILSFLTKDAATKECDASEFVKAYAKVWAIDI